MLKKMKQHLKAFASNERGSELMQWAIIIIIVAALAGVAYVIAGSLGDKLNEAQGVLDNLG